MSNGNVVTHGVSDPTVVSKDLKAIRESFAEAFQIIRELPERLDRVESSFQISTRLAEIDAQLKFVRQRIGLEPPESRTDIPAQAETHDRVMDMQTEVPGAKPEPDLELLAPELSESAPEPGAHDDREIAGAGAATPKLSGEAQPEPAHGAKPEPAEPQSQPVSEPHPKTGSGEEGEAHQLHPGRKRNHKP
jgi:hypothetical protein